MERVGRLVAAHGPPLPDYIEIEIPPERFLEGRDEIELILQALVGHGSASF